MTPYGAKIWVNIGSSNGLLPDGITWTNVDLSSLRSSDVNLMAISFEISQPSVTKISLKIIFLRVYWNFPGANELTHWGRVTHICVSKLAIIDSDNAWSAPSHYLNQCWNIVNWSLGNKNQWNFNRNSYIFIQQNPFETVVWKMASILSRPQCVKQVLVFHEAGLQLPATSHFQDFCIFWKNSK